MFVCLRRLVVVDVDTGTDDALALLLLLAADAAGEVTLLGVTCVAGNTSLANVCRNTLRLLRAANRLDVSRVDRREPPRSDGGRGPGRLVISFSHRFPYLPEPTVP